MREAENERANSRARFGYFVVQAQAPSAAGSGEVSGVLENLGTGQKTAFGSTEELGRLLRDWGGKP